VLNIDPETLKDISIEKKSRRTLFQSKALQRYVDVIIFRAEIVTHLNQTEFYLFNARFLMLCRFSN